MLQSNFIADVVGLDTLAGARVYHQDVPQGAALPFIATQQVSGNQPTTLDERALFSRSTLRVAIFARKSAEAVAIDAAIRARFNTFRGLLGSTRIHASRVESTGDSVSYADGDNIIKGSGLDVFFLYQE